MMRLGAHLLAVGSFSFIVRGGEEGSLLLGRRLRGELRLITRRRPRFGPIPICGLVVVDLVLVYRHPTKFSFKPLVAPDVIEPNVRDR